MNTVASPKKKNNKSKTELDTNESTYVSRPIEDFNDEIKQILQEDFQLVE